MLPIQTLHRHSDGVNTMVVNGDLLLSGSDDMEIKVKRCLHCFQVADTFVEFYIIVH